MSYYNDEDDEVNGNTTDPFFSFPFPELGVMVVDDPRDLLHPWKNNRHFLANILTYSATMLLGLIGNTAFIIVIFIDRKSRTTTNIFLVSLTVADLLMLTVCAPLEIVRLFVVWLDFGGTACKMGHYVMMLSFTASVINLTAVSLERFIVIVYPIKARSICTMKNCRRAVVGVWLASIILACPIIWVMDEESTIYTNENRTINVTAYYCRDVDTIIFPTYRVLVLFFIPGVLMIAFYSVVIRELWLSTRNISTLTSNRSSAPEQSYSMKNDPLSSPSTSQLENRFSKSKNQQLTAARTDLHQQKGVMTVETDQSENRSDNLSAVNGHGQATPKRLRFLSPSPRYTVRFRQLSPANPANRVRDLDDVKKTRKQVIKMLIIIVLLFLLCWGPTITFDMLIGLDQQQFSQGSYLLKWISSVLPFVHCCINPVIYCFMSKNFRASLSKCFKQPCYCFKKQRNYSETQSLRITRSTQIYHENQESIMSQRFASFSVDVPTTQTDFEMTKM